MGSFHDAERLLRPFGVPVDCRFDFPRFHGGVKRLKFRSRPNITNITLRVIYSCRGGGTDGLCGVHGLRGVTEVAAATDSRVK